ncbi:MAG: ornithine cyclodeaminase family protein [Polymorphobacter sp.]
MPHFDAAAIAARLPWPRLIAALADGLRLPITSPARHYHYPEGSRDLLLIMPAWSARWMGIKSAAMFPDNPASGASGIASCYVLMDRATGHVAATFDGTELTNRRTAAASALATDALARTDSRTLLVMGTGPLAHHAAGTHAAVRDYTRILVWGRTPAKAQALAAALAAEGLPAAAMDDAEGAARQADVITCVTSARKPVLHGAWLRPGTHVDLIGAHEPDAREVDSDLMAMAQVWADVRANVLREAGDVIIPIAEGRITAAAIGGDLADLAARPGGSARGDAGVTVFKSVGFAAQDLIAALAVLG